MSSRLCFFMLRIEKFLDLCYNIVDIVQGDNELWK